MYFWLQLPAAFCFLAGQQAGPYGYLWYYPVARCALHCASGRWRVSMYVSLYGCLRFLPACRPASLYASLTIWLQLLPAAHCALRFASGRWRDSMYVSLYGFLRFLPVQNALRLQCQFLLTSLTKKSKRSA